MADTIRLTIRHENTYEVYEDETFTEVHELPHPKHHESLADWADDVLFDETGSRQEGGKPEGDSWYDLEVLESSDPDAVPVGETFEFGY